MFVKFLLKGKCMSPSLLFCMERKFIDPLVLFSLIFLLTLGNKGFPWVDLKVFEKKFYGFS